MAHHRECFLDHGRCSIFGCVPPPAPEGERVLRVTLPDWIHGLLLVAFLLVVGALALVGPMLVTVWSVT